MRTGSNKLVFNTHYRGLLVTKGFERMGISFFTRLSGEIITSLLAWYHVVSFWPDLIQRVLVTSPAEVAVRWTRRRDLTWKPNM